MDGVGPKFLGKAVACFSSTTFKSGRGVGVDGGHGKSQLSHREPETELEQSIIYMAPGQWLRYLCLAPVFLHVL